MEETSITCTGDFSGAYGSALRDALMPTLALDSALPEDVLSMNGMSGRLYRRLINRIISRVPGARYLEVGSWGGSTACAAMYGNALKITCIDDWSCIENWAQFQDHAWNPRETFFAKTAAATSDVTDFSFVEGDFRKVDYSALGMFNIYLFDGPHEFEDQRDGVQIAQPALDDRYIQIVDDWNWPSARNGTYAAFDSCELNVECSIEIRTTQDDSLPVVAVAEKSAWHNGYLIAVVKRG